MTPDKLLPYIAFDCEIKSMIPKRGEVKNPKLKYCGGWTDYIGMGISVLVAYDSQEEQYRVFCDDNISEFQKLIDKAPIVAGFNSKKFDEPLCAAHCLTIPPEKSYDVIVELWKSEGLSINFDYRTHGGYTLDATCHDNLYNVRKSGHGADAPRLWQEGKIGEVIDYCINDVRMLVGLLEMIRYTGHLKSPKTGIMRRLDFPGGTLQA